jgi:asparagine synthase (glutamine-hydrolysing)
MSAQAGIWNIHGRPIHDAFLAKLSLAIEQYGSDGGNTQIDGSIGMVYRPFHTTLESRLEHQPYVSRHGIMTWDGRLDNREDLMRELLDDLGGEQTDVGIVMAAYEKWGMDCFRRLIGDWALSVWNSNERTLFLARDYAGVKPLYYNLGPNSVIWCSYLAPLVLSGDQFNLNEDYIASYLAAYPEAHLTPYREVYAVPPGTFVRIHEGTATVHSYWGTKQNLRISYKTDREYEEHFRHVFRQAVRRRLRSDSPILAELSGGLDSSSIVCMADEIIAKEQGHTPRLDSLSYYDTREPGGDERPYFTKVEARRGREGHHFDASQYDSSFSLRYQTFLATPGSLGTERTSDSDLRALMDLNGYRVVLSGIGGDELLGGVPDPRTQLADLIFQLRPVDLSRQLMAWSLVKRRPWIQLFLRASVLLLPVSFRARLMSEGKVAPWIDPHFARRYRFAVRQLGPSGRFGFWLPSRKDYAQTLASLIRKIAYASAGPPRYEERRFPYLDQTLVEFLTAIPIGQLLRPGERRSLMRRALANFLPVEILSRQTKAVTARRHIVAIAASWPGLQALFESPLSAQLGYINIARFRESLTKAKNGDAPQLLRLLKGIALELWLQEMTTRGVIHVPGKLSACCRSAVIQVNA